MVTRWRCLDEYANMYPLPSESESAMWECASSFSSSSFAIRFSSCQPQLILIGRVVLWDSFLRQSFFNWHFYIFGRHWQSFEDDVCPRIEFGDPPSLHLRWRSRVPVAVALLFPPAKHALWGPMTTNKFSSRDGKLLEGIGSQNFARSKTNTDFCQNCIKASSRGEKVMTSWPMKEYFLAITSL